MSSTDDGIQISTRHTTGPQIGTRFAFLRGMSGSKATNINQRSTWGAQHDQGRKAGGDIMAKVEHFWVSVDVADAFVAWLSNQAEMVKQEPMRGTFTPERARFLFRDAKYGIEQVFMLYDSAAYRCVNVPRNTLGVMRAWVRESKTTLPLGTLDSARGDGKDAASIEAARAEKKAAAKAAKAKAKTKAAPAPEAKTKAAPAAKAKAKAAKTKAK